jgi:DNA-directed RNA polymerase subunit M/transcription elongation factor TFIIS
MEDLRVSLIFLISNIFSKLNTLYNFTYNVKHYSVKFENDMFNILDNDSYIKISSNIDTLLLYNTGYFPEDINSIKFMQEKITTLYVLSCNTSKVNNPRYQIIKMFTMLLYKYKLEHHTQTDILNMAKNIEKSCYNAIVKNSKISEDPPCRQWDSPIFIDMYSNRCGIIYNLLNPESISCKTYGSMLLNDILNNNIDISIIGYKNEKELCPQSIQKEKDEIAIRSEQYVIEKESNLFKCPKCKERRVTYKEIQLRALDEAPDYLCRCLNCNYKFKV